MNLLVLPILITLFVSLASFLLVGASPTNTPPAKVFVLVGSPIILHCDFQISESPGFSYSVRVATLQIPFTVFLGLFYSAQDPLWSLRLSTKLVQI